MALRVEKAFGVKMDTLLRMQAAFDIAKTRKRAGKIRVRPYRDEEVPVLETVRSRER
jgi:antitoxin HigA-1